ncbi:vitamin K-dependent protein C isoform X2 [Syngnathoides biaculeatus]|uniref:vitamin K-dependent protein C isoform X2 n=1 Tax=Syngnathoides biaculeatus TaxID=300417 RepID=UPI002ADDF4BD|nr:vitamin K-dependent protein C isoform X2 [Syngnathoides biaculeatus]
MLASIAQTTLLLVLSASLVESTVFLQRSSAGQILRSIAATRRRRANSKVLEELFPGDLERECYEERCSQEEAGEIFQSQEKTLEFWFRYTNLNLCATNPCVNGGRCVLERGDFVCLCPPRYHGSTCHLELLSCGYRNGGCLQYCTDLPGGAGVQCGCAEGFRLDSDGQRCSKTVAFPCGVQQPAKLQPGRSLLRLFGNTNDTEGTDAILDEANFTTDAILDEPNFTAQMDTFLKYPIVATETDAILDDTNVTMKMDAILDDDQAIRVNWTQNADKPLNPRIVGGTLERLGGSPWQVLIHRADGYGFCGGTLVSDRWVVSAAHCFQQTAHHVTIGDFDKQRRDPGEQTILVEEVVLHPHFHDFTMDSDVALLYLAEPVVRGPTAIPACLPDPHLSKYLIKEDNRGLVTGWGATHYLRRSSRFLRKVALPVVKHRTCMQSTEQATWMPAWMLAAGTAAAPSWSTTGEPGT